MNKAKRNDCLKNLVIALLLVSALYLLYRAVFYSADTIQPENGMTSAATFSSEPAYLLVTGLDGTHTATKYNRVTRNKLLSQFSALLGEALGSAGDPKAVTAVEWQSALRCSGVLFDYIYPLPLSVIASSLGTVPKGLTSSNTARRLYLSIGDSAVRLYYISGTDGNTYRCTTALSASSLLAKLGDYHGGEAKFAFELGGECASLDPYFIFSGEETKLEAVSASNPLPGGEVTKLLSGFGMSSRASSGYSEKGGAVVYVEGGKSLRVDNSGDVLFCVTDKDGVTITHGGTLTQAEIVSACASICENSIARTAGISELVLTSCKTDETTGTTNVEFGYALGGVPVTLSNGAPAATFLISGGTITRAELCFRKYLYTGESLSALPEAQAAAIAGTGGGEPVLTYNDKGGSVTASWIVK